jgi:hypothetical protein
MLQAKVDANCRRCGKCCRNSKPIGVQDREVWQIARFLKVPSVVAREIYFARGSDRQIVMKDPCPFLTDEGCRIYDVRPRTCRNFPFLSDVSLAAWKRSQTIIATQYCEASRDAIEELKKTVLAETGKAPRETHGIAKAHTVAEELADIEASQQRSL